MRPESPCPAAFAPDVSREMPADYAVIRICRLRRAGLSADDRRIAMPESAFRAFLALKMVMYPAGGVCPATGETEACFTSGLPRKGTQGPAERFFGCWQGFSGEQRARAEKRL